MFDLTRAEDALRLMHFLETCCAALPAGGAPWRPCAARCWDAFYPEVPFRQETGDELWRLLHRRRGDAAFQRYGQAVALVFQYGLDHVHNSCYLYYLLLARAVNMAAAYAGEDAAGRVCGGDDDELPGDALRYRNRVRIPYALDPAEESALILRFLSLYTRDGRYDAAALASAAASQAVFRANFQALARRAEDAGAGDASLAALQERLDEAEKALEKADFDLKSALIRRLDRGSSGCRLGQLYRIAAGLDEPGDVRETLRACFALLEAAGIRPVEEERLDQAIEASDPLYGRSVPYLGLDGPGPRTLRYPGWSVGGVQTEPPVYDCASDAGRPGEPSGQS